MVAVIGDGALTGGMAFEGLNNAGELGKRLIVILNDNEWSISPNVGAIARYLTKLTTSRMYRAFERDVYELLGQLPRLGQQGAGGGAPDQGGARRTWWCRACCSRSWASSTSARSTATTSTCSRRRCRDLKRFEGPVLLHVVTKKGKGYAPAEKRRRHVPRHRHVRPRDRHRRARARKKTYTHVFGETAIEIAREAARRGRGDRGDDRQHRAQAVRQEVPGPLLRRRHGRGARRDVLGRARRRRADPAHHHLLDVPAARHRPDHPRRRGAEPARRVLPRPRRPGGRGRRAAARRVRRHASCA